MKRVPILLPWKRELTALAAATTVGWLAFHLLHRPWSAGLGAYLGAATIHFLFEWRIHRRLPGRKGSSLLSPLLEGLFWPIALLIFVRDWISLHRSVSPSGNRDQDEQFANQGTTRRELEIARILNQRLGVRVVKAVRLSSWNVGGARELLACVDLSEGGSLPTVHIPQDMTARQQAEEIYQFVRSAMRVSGP